jgi:hypothetical protein
MLNVPFLYGQEGGNSCGGERRLARNLRRTKSHERQADASAGASMSTSKESVRFFVAPFSVDGEMQGLDVFEPSALSGRWLGLCRDHLERYGSVFDRAWEGNLSHIRTKFTSASGVAFISFYVESRLVASIALGTGRSSSAESEALRMFVISLRRVDLVRVAANSGDPFQKVLMIEERPLMIVVPWPDLGVSDQDHALVRELATHLAGAFFGQTQL